MEKLRCWIEEFKMFFYLEDGNKCYFIGKNQKPMIIPAEQFKVIGSDQFTFETDNNGKEIFVNDYLVTSEGCKFLVKINYNSNSFEITDKEINFREPLSFIKGDRVIAGNTYEQYRGFKHD